MKKYVDFKIIQWLNVDLKENTFSRGKNKYVEYIKSNSSSNNVSCEAVFWDQTCERSLHHEKRIYELIENTKEGFILCVVAWFTNLSILDALISAKKRGVMVLIVLQKEDFLRPDDNLEKKDKNSFNNILRKKYDSLGIYKTKHKNSETTILTDFLNEDGEKCNDIDEGDICSYDWGTDTDRCYVSAVCCVGNHNQSKNPNHPRTHNNFFVFGCQNDVPMSEPMTIGEAYIKYNNLHNNYKDVEIFEEAGPEDQIRGPYFRWGQSPD